MKCPSCQKHDLNQKGLKGGLNVDTCPDCRGIWLDRGELLRLVSHADLVRPYVEQLSWDSVQVGRKCPRCELPMYQGRLDTDQKLDLEYCRQCDGIWFDAAELKKTVAFLTELSSDLADDPIPAIYTPGNPAAQNCRDSRLTGVRRAAHPDLPELPPAPRRRRSPSVKLQRADGLPERSSGPTRWRLKAHVPSLTTLMYIAGVFATIAVGCMCYRYPEVRSKLLLGWIALGATSLLVGTIGILCNAPMLLSTRRRSYYSHTPQRSSAGGEMFFALIYASIYGLVNWKRVFPYSAIQIAGYLMLATGYYIHQMERQRSAENTGTQLGPGGMQRSAAPSEPPQNLKEFFHH